MTAIATHGHDAESGKPTHHDQTLAHPGMRMRRRDKRKRDKGGGRRRGGRGGTTRGGEQCKPKGSRKRRAKVQTTREPAAQLAGATARARWREILGSSRRARVGAAGPRRRRLGAPARGGAQREGGRRCSAEAPRYAPGQGSCLASTGGPAGLPSEQAGPLGVGEPAVPSAPPARSSP